MAIKVLENANKIYKTKQKNNEAQNTGASFADTLKNVMNKANTSDVSNINKGKDQISKDYLEEITRELNIDSKSIKKEDRELYFAFKALYDVFGSSISPDCYRKDSTIDIRKVIQNFGDGKISDRDLTRLNRSIDVLYRDGYLTEDDYNYAVDWISTKMLALRVKIEKEEGVKAVYESIENRRRQDNYSEEVKKNEFKENKSNVDDLASRIKKSINNTNKIF